MPRHPRLDLSTVVLGVFAAAARGGPADYKTYVVSPAINNPAILPGEPLPEVCRSQKVVTIRACRGEYEPASFAVLTDCRLDCACSRAPQWHKHERVFPR